MSNHRVEISLAAMCLMLVAGAGHAQTAISPADAAAATAAVTGKPVRTTAATIRPTSGTSFVADVHGSDVSAYEAANLHALAPSPQLTAEVMAALAPNASAAAVHGAYAAGAAAPAATPSAPVGSDAPAVAGNATAGPATPLLDLSPKGRLPGAANGMSTGMRLPLPDADALSRDTAAAIARSFHAAPGTADQAASDAADAATTGDPLLDERIALARTVFKVDGTDELVRHDVATQMMKVVVGEVAKYIDFSKLSETDKYRLSAIAATAQTELEEKVLNLNARVEATYLTKQDLTLLIVAYDNDAVRKQTKLRLADTGKTDSDGSLDIEMAQLQIVKAFEKAQ